jgi:5-bromo-4-chloroindolyl phosphate hydrolysis protein
MNKQTSSGTQGTVTRKINSPLPYYIVSALWLVCAFTVRMYLLSSLLIIAAASVVLYFLCRMIFPPRLVEVRLPEQPVMSGIRDVDEVLEEGRGYIKKLRELNDLISDEDLSNDMDRLESVSNSIFDYIAEHPDKVKMIRRFVNYYLPSTIKLLETYHKMSKQGIRGGNISETMARIEKIVDTMILVYEKQLDTLFSDEAIDIATDISVLERMFTAEGLGSPDFKQ